MQKIDLTELENMLISTKIKIYEKNRYKIDEKLAKDC